MRCSSIMALVASAAVANANRVLFWTVDNQSRTVYFTPNTGFQAIASVRTNSGSNVTVEFPYAWAGNWYAVIDGQPNVPGMLGEVQFDGWNGITYFDVSAIVQPNDVNNVHQMFPVGTTEPMSGCEVFPCNNAYYHPDDVQTKATYSKDLWCTLGQGSTGITFLEAQ